MNSSLFSSALHLDQHQTPMTTRGTILLLDLHRFQALAAHHPPAELFNILNPFFSKSSSIIENEGGIVEQYLGDGLLARFTQDDSESRAKRCAKLIVENLSSQYPLRIGISTGEIALGWLGGDSTKQFSSLGDTVNKAFAACKTSNIFAGVVVSQKMFDKSL